VRDNVLHGVGKEEKNSNKEEERLSLFNNK